MTREARTQTSRKLASAMILFALLAYGQEVLTNESIAKMVFGRAEEGLIVEMIGSHAGNYALSSDNLIALKQKRVSDCIVGAMVTKGGTEPLPAPARTVMTESVTGSVDGPTCPKRLGFFYLDAGDREPMSALMTAGSGSKASPIPIFGAAGSGFGVKGMDRP